MPIFAETISKAISDYRYLLRRYLSQSERMVKLQKLRLKDAHTYQSDLSLYQAAHAIITDIEDNMLKTEGSYYSYSGIGQFCQYLKEYLNDYEVEGNSVVHHARKASRALLQAIQLIATPKDRLNEVVAKHLFECNHLVANFGSNEQFNLYLQTLERHQAESPGFYTRIIAHVESLRASSQMKKSEEAA